MIRITGGTWKGRAIRFLKGPQYRPTQAKVRQAIFNLLGERVCGARVLDLFAGSGALGIEALSRGAAACVFVEQDRRCAELARANLALLGTMGRGQVVCQEVLAALRRLGADPFDLVLLDPPYHRDWPKKTLKALTGYARLNEQAVVVVEHHRHDFVPEREGSLARVKQARYGDTMVSIFWGQAPDST